MDINELRAMIDEIDAEILKLFERRMEASKKIGEYKKEKNLPLYDEQREIALLQSRAKMMKNDSLDPYVKQLFKTIMQLSKGYQFQTVTDKNIVLIGMMGSGKTSKGRLLAERLGMAFSDIDTEIEKDAGMTISEIFEMHGKFKFREMESKKIEELSSLSRHVISTGGGVVLSDSNMTKLKKNGIVVFINRNIDEIVRTIDTKKRPLLAKGAHALYAIYNERLPLYKRWSDYEITDEDKSVEDSVDDLIKTIFR
ncbi:MAG: Shikimate kinase 1 [Firmicutes bacterium ADurb.Bin193]|nr:MAG: Shikimate kinase 1 [Firmicutes bacterium ADurb.Bin193]